MTTEEFASLFKSNFFTREQVNILRRLYLGIVADIAAGLALLQQWVIDNFAPINNPLFTGDPRAPTPALGDDDTSIATTAYVQNEFDDYDDDVVHIFGNETIAGIKTFTDPISAGTNRVSGKDFLFINNGTSSYLQIPGPTLTTGYSQIALSNGAGSAVAGIWLNGSAQSSHGGNNSVNIGANANVVVGFVQNNLLRGYIDLAAAFNWNSVCYSRSAAAGWFAEDRGNAAALFGFYADAGIGRIWNSTAGDMLSFQFSSGRANFAKGIVVGAGSTLAASVNDTTQHLMLWASPEYGINVTSGAVNIVANGSGQVQVSSSAFRPLSDNARTCGASGSRWSVVWAGTATISTSDANHKTPVRSLEQAEKEAGFAMLDEIGIYQWLASIDEKGVDKARLHPGLTVQRAIEVMQLHGLDPMRYSFICYDQWDAQEEVHDEAGGLLQEAREAGEVFSFRGEQLTQFMLAGLLAKLKAKGVFDD